MNKIFLVFAMIIATTFSFQATAQNKKVTGEWKYEVNQAPYGYNKGVLSFENQKDGKLAGKVIFDSGYTVNLTNVLFKEGVLSAEATIDGERVKLVSTIKEKEKELAGTVDTSMGIMNLKAKKVIPVPEKKK